MSHTYSNIHNLLCTYKWILVQFCAFAFIACGHTIRLFAKWINKSMEEIVWSRCRSNVHRCAGNVCATEAAAALSLFVCNNKLPFYHLTVCQAIFASTVRYIRFVWHSNGVQIASCFLIDSVRVPERIIIGGGDGGRRSSIQFTIWHLETSMTFKCGQRQQPQAYIRDCHWITHHGNCMNRTKKWKTNSVCT